MLIRRDGTRRRSPAFAASALLHLAALLAVVFSPVAPPGDPRPLYNHEIRPYESHIIWYNLRKKLPEVKPAEAADAKPPRALRRFQQQIVAGQIELPRPPQLIRVPAPQIPLAQPLKLPNLLAVAPSKPVRPFAPPPERARPPEARPLPAAPQIHDSASPRESGAGSGDAAPSPAAVHPAGAAQIRAGAHCVAGRAGGRGGRANGGNAAHSARLSARRRRKRRSRPPPSRRWPPRAPRWWCRHPRNPPWPSWVSSRSTRRKSPNRLARMRPASRPARAPSRKAARRLRPARRWWCPT